MQLAFTLLTIATIGNAKTKQQKRRFAVEGAIAFKD
jgi:hypothetical protein